MSLRGAKRRGSPSSFGEKGVRIATGAFGTLAMTGIILRLFGGNIYLIPVGYESRHEERQFVVLVREEGLRDKAVRSDLCHCEERSDAAVRSFFGKGSTDCRWFNLSVCSD